MIRGSEKIRCMIYKSFMGDRTYGRRKGIYSGNSHYAVNGIYKAIEFREVLLEFLERIILVTK